MNSIAFEPVMQTVFCKTSLHLTGNCSDTCRQALCACAAARPGNQFKVQSGSGQPTLDQHVHAARRAPLWVQTATCLCCSYARDTLGKHVVRFAAMVCPSRRVQSRKSALIQVIYGSILDDWFKSIQVHSNICPTSP